MKYRNKVLVQVRVREPENRVSSAHGRIRCRNCEKMVPQGCDRPYCLEHSVYAQAIIQKLAEKAGENQKSAG